MLSGGGKRPRYALLQAFLGDGWTLFSATASDQCHVEVTRGEVPLVTAVANAAAPAPWAAAAVQSLPPRGDLIIYRGVRRGGVVLGRGRRGCRRRRRRRARGSAADQ